MRNIIRIIISFIIIISIFNDVHAQSQGFQWAKSVGGFSDDAGSGITTDAQGNVYVTGCFSATADFDPGPGVFNLTTNGDYDIFLLKLDPLGNFLWAQSFGGSSDDVGYDVVVDASGNLYTVGFFQTTVDFNPTSSTYTIASAGGPDVYLSKFDASGNFVWAKTFGGNLNDGSISLDLDQFGNVYVAGYFQNVVDFDPGPSVFNLASAVGSYDVFILKLDGGGNFQWAKRIGGNGDDSSAEIEINSVGDICVTGTFKFTVDFDPGPGTFTMTCVSGNLEDIFVLKLDALGNFIWAKKISGVSDEFAGGLTNDASDNIYLTGSFNGATDFDPGPSTFNLTPNSQDDIFIAKLDVNGNFVWARQIGSTSYDHGYCIGTDSNGSVYAAGDFGGVVDFDPGSGVYNVSASGTNAFIIKLDNGGNFSWVKNIGGNSVTNGIYNIHLDSFNAIHSTGWYTGVSDFDYSSAIYNLTSAGSRDVFVQKLGPCLSPTFPTNITPNSNQIQCSGTSETLVVTSSQTVSWFATSTSTVSSGLGNVFITPILGSGTYTYYAESSNTCSASDERTPVTLTIIPSPTLVTSNIPSIICVGQSATLTVLGANSFTWIPSISMSGVISPSSTINYTIYGVGNNGCISTAIITESVASCNGFVSRDKEFFEIGTYPNPFTDFFNLNVPCDLAIEIINITGEKVMSRNVEKGDSQLNVSKLPSGLYFLKIIALTFKGVIKLQKL